MNDHQAVYETQRMYANRMELIDLIERAHREDGTIEPLPGLHLNRSAMPKGPLHSATTPSFCVIAQGRKEIHLGESIYRYDPFHYLLVTMEIPAVSSILDVSPEQPYLSLRLDLSPAIISSVMDELDQLSNPCLEVARAIDVSPLDGNLLDASVRLTRLLHASEAEARILMPLITREIVYRLLLGAQGDHLRHLAMQGGFTSYIAKAVEHLQQHFDQPLRVEQLARELGMSVSGFHHHFKAVTALSPLQFQKRLRLQEARRLMLGEAMDAASAAFRVGYNDAAHFNREYKSLFGIPPIRDVQRLRETAIALPE